MTIRVDRPIVPGQILFDERQAATMLGISDKTLRTLRVPSVRVKTRVLYRRVDLEAYVEQLRAAS